MNFRMGKNLLLCVVFVPLLAVAVQWAMAPPRMPAAIPNEVAHVLRGAPVTDPTPFGVHPSPETPHPFTAPQGAATIHADGASSDVHRTGPTGKNLKVVSRVGSKWPGGMCATLTFDKGGRLVALCASLAGFQLHLMAPRTLELLANYHLPNRPSTFAAVLTADPEKIMLDTSGGAYYYLDDQDRVVLADAAQHIQRVAHRFNAATQAWEFYNDGDWDVGRFVPHDCFAWNNWWPRAEQCDPITAVTADFAGHVWFVTRQGLVGVLDTERNVVATTHLREEMQNGITVGEDGVYLVTTHALYCMEIARGFGFDTKPTTLWKATYDRGTYQKVGMLSVGSGTAPTLFDRRYATINDNADDQFNLLVYWRNSKNLKPEQRDPRQGADGELVCKVPLFAKGASASDNSMIAVGNSIMMENNFGYRNGIQQARWDTEAIPGGIQRIDVVDAADGKGKECKIVWTNDKERAPSCVAKLGAEVGLAYFYTFEDSASAHKRDASIPDDGTVTWFFTAVDAHTGATRWSLPMGTGVKWDNNWAPITLGPDGTAYIGILQGIAAVYDGDD